MSIFTARYSKPRRAWRRVKLLCRSSFGRDLWPLIERHEATAIYGYGYGEWRVIPALLKTDSVIYSFGVGMDITFDLALVERTGATVHAFDPTPRVVEWLATQKLPGQFVFHDVGLGIKDETLWFNAPQDSKNISHTIVSEGT